MSSSVSPSASEAKTWRWRFVMREVVFVRMLEYQDAMVASGRRLYASMWFGVD